MSEKKRTAREGLISYRFAVAVITALFAASAAGWIVSEFVPPDFLERKELYRDSWGAVAASLVGALHLYDPFHSAWYRFLLALFFVVLLLCVVTRARRLALRSWRVALPAGAAEIAKRELSFESSWRSLEGGAAGAKLPLVRYGESHGRRERIEPERLRALFARIASLLRARGYRVVSRDGGDAIAFAAYTGRWRSPGTMLFHAGILVITIGGILGSFAGWRELIYVREGAVAPLPPDSSLSIRVDDFEIAVTGRSEIADFISSVSILDAHGETISGGTIEVNRPMKVAGRRIYQSQFTIDENEFRGARIEYARRDRIGTGSIDVAPGQAVAVADSLVTLMAIRFIPDFRMSPDGPFSASSFPSNPALEIEVASAAGTERGWLFLYHPDFSKRFEAPVNLVLSRCDPVYYTGLEISANPGASVLLAGIALATAGLLLMYLCNPRLLKGIAGSEALVVAGVEYRWKASFGHEFDEIREAIRREIERRE